MNVSIIGATGYTGAELIRLLSVHKEVEIKHITARSEVGTRIDQIYPNLTGYCDLVLEAMNLEKIMSDSDLIFAALPYGLSIEIAEHCEKNNVKFIDFGADFRLNDTEEYEKWYQVPHTNKNLNKKAVYGLPEINREKIKNAQIIANPGCFPTSVILALYPLLKEDLIDKYSIIIDAKSGTTGAGRSEDKLKLHAELVDNFKPYGAAKHRHMPEIKQELSKLSKEPVSIIFTPHLLPIDRGILSTIYVDLKEKISIDKIREYYHIYDKEAFVHLLPIDILPNTKFVRGSNNCHINLVLCEETGKLKIFSAIDNIGKGASGQALQNMNLMLGIEETEGLKGPGLNP